MSYFYKHRRIMLINGRPETFLEYLARYRRLHRYLDSLLGRHMEHRAYDDTVKRYLQQGMLIDGMRVTPEELDNTFVRVSSPIRLCCLNYLTGYDN